MARLPSSVAALLVVAMGAAACSSDGESPSTNPTSNPTATAGPVTSASPGPTSAPATDPGEVTLFITELRLINSEESDNALRVLVDSPVPDLTIKVTGVPNPNKVILVCPTNAIQPRTPVPGSACVTPASAEPVRVPHGTTYKGVEIVQVGVSGAGPAGNSTAISEIAISYPATSRLVQFRLPPLQQGEAGGRPSFRMTPVGPGAYQATAAFTAAIGNQGEAELTLVSGTSTQNMARGPGPSLSGTLSPPTEATIRLRNSGSVTLTQLTLNAQFP